MVSVDDPEVVFDAPFEHRREHIVDGAIPLQHAAGALERTRPIQEFTAAQQHGDLVRRLTQSSDR